MRRSVFSHVVHEIFKNAHFFRTERHTLFVEHSATAIPFRSKQAQFNAPDAGIQYSAL